MKIVYNNPITGSIVLQEVDEKPEFDFIEYTPEVAAQIASLNYPILHNGRIIENPNPPQYEELS